MGNPDLLVPCSACYNRLKYVERLYEQEDKFLQERFPYSRKIKIWHINDFFAQDELLKRLKNKVVLPLKDLKVVPYYGCLNVRHPRVVGCSNYEDPQEMDKILQTLGTQPLNWSYKTDCCGGSLLLTRVDIVRTLVKKLIEKAIEAGAEAIVTDCPLCQANLDTQQKQIDTLPKIVPVFYITELMGLALGVSGVDSWWGKHLVNPQPVLAAMSI